MRALRARNGNSKRGLMRKWALAILGLGAAAFFLVLLHVYVFIPRAHSDMGNKRARKIAEARASGKAGSARSYSLKQKRAKALPTPAAPAVVQAVEEDPLRIERERYFRDIKAFYKELLAPRVKNSQGLLRADSLGRIHDYMWDFCNLNEPREIVRYTKLMQYLPKRDKDGNFTRETWLYFPTMQTKKPEVGYGDDNAVARLFRGEKGLWQGLIFRVNGNGKYQCILVPRGHLKSSMITQVHTLWKVVRDPSFRVLMRSVKDDLAQKHLGWIKMQFEANERFKKFFGKLKPDKREGSWNTEFIQLLSYKGGVDTEAMRGADPTIQTLGMQSDPVGSHIELALFDDVVGEINKKGEQLEKAVERTENMLPVLDPESEFRNVATKWEQKDPSECFTNPQFCETIAADSSFMVATALDGNKKVPAPVRLTRNGYGAPLWPEGQTHQTLLRKRSKDDRFHYGQYFNQIKGLGGRTFSTKWIRRYGEAGKGLVGLTPKEVASALKLNVFAGFDTTSGKREQKGKLDYTACVVLGQTPDRERIFVLDAWKQRLTAGMVGHAFVSTALKWREIVFKYRGTTFQAGFEDIGFTNYLGVLLDNELRKRDPESTFGFTDFSGKENPDRIGVLAQAYQDGRVFWPESLDVTPFSSTTEPAGEPYDAIKELLEEYELYPGGGDGCGVNDLLAAHGISYAMCPLMAYRDTSEVKTDAGFSPAPVARSKRAKGVTYRDEHEEESGGGMDLGGYGDAFGGGVDLGGYGGDEQ